jgi:hypothetical protein
MEFRVLALLLVVGVVLQVGHSVPGKTGRMPPQA